MPVAVSYPGVYIEEIPSGVRAITGVATSITAFIGRAPSGQVDVPVTVNSFGDFERNFGKLHPDYPLSYAVRDFYQNGGAQAVVVRLYKPIDHERLQRRSSGSHLWIWRLLPRCLGQQLEGSHRRRVSADVAARLGLTAADLFNVTVRDMATGTTERIGQSERERERTPCRPGTRDRIRFGQSLQTGCSARYSGAVTSPGAGSRQEHL
jgi:hypothetical protein